MTKVHTLGGPGRDDYNITLTEGEMDALKEAVRDADGRKGEVKKAREVLGIYD